MHVKVATMYILSFLHDLDFDDLTRGQVSSTQLRTKIWSLS